MLKIRSDQMDDFGKDAKDKFVAQMILHLREHFADETKSRSDADLEKHIRGELEDAARFDLAMERDIVSYLHLSMTFGQRFIEREDNAWMRNYLTDESIALPADRIQRLYRAVIRKMEIDAENKRTLAEFQQAGQKKD